MSEQNRFVALLIWFFITLFYCYQYVLRILPNIISTHMFEKYSIGASEYASFAGLYYVGYVLVHIPIGVFLARFGAKAVLPLCIICTAAGLAPVIYGDSWMAAVLGRTLTGIGSSAAAIGALQIFRSLYPDRFGMMVGFMVSVSLVIAVYIGQPLAEMVSTIGADDAMFWLMVAGLVMSAITFILLPKDLSEISHSDIKSDIMAVLSNYKLLFAAICAGLMVGPMEGFADAWGSAFLIKIYSLEKTVADGITFEIIRGMCAGCIILPYISDKTKSYFGITILCGLVMGAAFLYILTGEVKVGLLKYICFVVGIFSAYQVVMLTKIASFVSEERSGIAAAVGNMIIMAFGMVFHKSIGLGLDSMWDGEMLDGIKFYSPEAFTYAISVIPGAISMAIVGLVILTLNDCFKKKKKA